MILVGATIPAFKMVDDGHWWHWLEGAEAISAQADVHWLATLQTDARGDGPFQPLLERLDTLAARGVPTSAYRFAIDTGEAEMTSESRIAGICVGRNLIIEAALRDRSTEWIYFADADISTPADTLAKLLELDWPVCGAHVCGHGNVSLYGLDGPHAGDYPGDARWHWNTAGSLLVRRDVFRRVPWRWDPDAGDSDDPATQAEMARLGWPTLVRHDVPVQHHPASIWPLERRGHDLAVYR